MNTEEQNELPKCPICISPVGLRKRKTTDCGHIFHRRCLRVWTSNNDTCPVCRANINSEEDNAENLIFTIFSLVGNRMESEMSETNRLMMSRIVQNYLEISKLDRAVKGLVFLFTFNVLIITGLILMRK